MVFAFVYRCPLCCTARTVLYRFSSADLDQGALTFAAICTLGVHAPDTPRMELFATHYIPQSNTV